MMKENLNKKIAINDVMMCLKHVLYVYIIFMLVGRVGPVEATRLLNRRKKLYTQCDTKNNSKEVRSEYI